MTTMTTVRPAVKGITGGQTTRQLFLGFVF